MPRVTNEPTTPLQKIDRCETLSHRPRLLLGKIGLDGHDRGVKLIGRLMRDSGVHVIYSGLWQTPRSLAISARDEDVDMVAQLGRLLPVFVILIVYWGINGQMSTTFFNQGCQMNLKVCVLSTQREHI